MQGKIYRGINHKDESASDLKIKNNLINFYNNQNHKLQIYKIR